MAFRLPPEEPLFTIISQQLPLRGRFLCLNTHEKTGVHTAFVFLLLGSLRHGTAVGLLLRTLGISPPAMGHSEFSGRQPWPLSTWMLQHPDSVFQDPAEARTLRSHISGPAGRTDALQTPDSAFLPVPCPNLQPAACGKFPAGIPTIGRNFSVYFLHSRLS